MDVMVRGPAVAKEKRCTRCLQWLRLDAFQRDRACPLGLRNECKLCRKIARCALPPKPGPTVTEQTCSICHLAKPLDAFHRCDWGKNGRRSECAPCRSIIRKGRH